MTISGALLPSSMVTFFKPAVLQMSSPTSRLPVKVIFPNPPIGAQGPAYLSSRPR